VGDPPWRRRLAFLAPALVILQVGLGLLTVATYVALPVVTLHLATGAGLLATLLSLFFQLGPRGARVAPPEGPARLDLAALPG